MIITGAYSNILKIHKVTEITKENNASVVNKYSHVAVLPVINNILEKIVYNQMSLYLYNNLLNDFQNGLRKGCEIEEAVVNVFSKAFDLIDHDILLEKLEFYGFQERDRLLLRSYPTNRWQFVHIGAHKSSSRRILTGVPQGSEFGPLLFSIFINNLRNLAFSGKIFMYTDDICLFYPYKNETIVKAYIERIAALICEFARINKLILNANETQKRGNRS